jgi:uncharacterized protein YjbI with pentapeptide repeats
VIHPHNCPSPLGLTRWSWSSRWAHKLSRACWSSPSAVIAGLLREAETGQLQKVLADGLRYAPSLYQADLQGCNRTDAYLGQKNGDKKKRQIRKKKRDSDVVNLTSADFFRADLTRASLKGVNAADAVFLEATLEETVLSGATLTDADFRRAKLTNADFTNSTLAMLTTLVLCPRCRAILSMRTSGRVVNVGHSSRSPSLSCLLEVKAG